MNRQNNRDGFRRCSCCKIEKQLVSDNFCSDKNRFLGYSYRCKSCDSVKKDLRKNRYHKLNEEQKENYKLKNRIYTSSGLGRATALICAYRKSDRKKNMECNLDRIFLVEEIFNKECVYCGEKDTNIGCDRIDNSKGHIKDNVVPCCKICNTTRMDNFTHEEMIEIGKTITLIKQKRKDGMHFQLSTI